MCVKSFVNREFVKLGETIKRCVYYVNIRTRPFQRILHLLVRIVRQVDVKIVLLRYMDTFPGEPTLSFQFCFPFQRDQLLKFEPF